MQTIYNLLSMKKFITTVALLLLVSYPVIGQKRVAQEIANYKSKLANFKKFNPLEKNNSKVDAETLNIVNNPTMATLKLSEVNEILENKFQTIEIQVPYNNQILNIELYQVEIFARNFKIKTKDSEDYHYQKGVHYRGIIKGNMNSIAAFNFFQNEMNGFVSTLELGNLNIGKLTESKSIHNIFGY